MGRATERGSESPLEMVMQFARHYTHGPKKQYDHLFFFSKDKTECDALTMFGGRVYRQYGGWIWFLGNRKALIALYKLLEPYQQDISNKSILSFMERIGKRLS